MTWPGSTGQSASLWRDVAGEDAEADARGAADELGTQVKELAVVVRLAAGDAFEEVWCRSKNEPGRSELGPLIAYLESLPARVVSSSK